jgi:hypothetical protein
VPDQRPDVLLHITQLGRQSAALQRHQPEVPVE